MCRAWWRRCHGSAQKKKACSKFLVSERPMQVANSTCPKPALCVKPCVAQNNKQQDGDRVIAQTKKIDVSRSRTKVSREQRIPGNHICVSIKPPLRWMEGSKFCSYSLAGLFSSLRVCFKRSTIPYCHFFVWVPKC